MTEDLTPETRTLLDGLAALGLPPLHTQSPAGARSMRAEAARLAGAPTPEAVAVVSDGSIEGPGGPLAIRFYEPERWRTGGGSIAYFHGGGWVLGDLETHDALCRALANSSGLRVMATDYRRAPESPHPAALEDAWVAAEWLRADEGGPLIVGGDSCGGHIATIVAARARGSGMSVAAQLLIYPVTDLSRFEAGSYERFAEGYWLTRAGMEWFRGHYLPGHVDPEEPDVSPLLREDLSNMPPAVIVAAACDVLLDQGRAYADRLRDAGCRVEYRLYDNVIHGFAAMPGVIPEGREAIGWASDTLRRFVGATT